MKVLLLGATGNLGSRLVPALLTHGHIVTVFVRSSRKLESLLPSSIYQQISIVEGDATNISAVKAAILDSKCEAVVTAAGVAAAAPWGSSDLPKIFRSIAEAVQQAGAERKQPLRVWFLSGMSVLQVPGTKNMMMDYVPVFLEHRGNLKLLQSLPPNSVDWSLLCPMTMTEESKELSVPTKLTQGRLVANANTPPMWKESWIGSIPLIGKLLTVMMNSSRYTTTLEQNADFIATDLETRDSPFIGKRVGVISASV
ncbi:hypothetical protein LTR86_010272 [Recurvomyces mirabilis]|nr:hypothetical protein LTR86_010272 [Recurvomyces mirabilis]